MAVSARNEAALRGIKNYIHRQHKNAEMLACSFLCVVSCTFSDKKEKKKRKVEASCPEKSQEDEVCPN